ncbi:MAG TPA: nuclear transport factor 2 family protein [Solirubrobacteraceae bacterium]|nr:nuclear transport factor 2 family protein [Solirubrobacteraceae bacterium]
MSTVSANPTRAIVEAYVAALQCGDESAIRDSFTEDAEWTLTGELPLSGTWKGRDVIFEEFLGGALASYAPGSISFEVTELVADGDTAAMEWITRGRSHAGAPYENRYLGLFKIRDGRIASIREYLASAAAAQALFGRTLGPPCT